MVPADGGLVTEPFVDALHLDKVTGAAPLIGDAALQAYTADGMADAARGIDLARAVKSITGSTLCCPRSGGRWPTVSGTACCMSRRSPTSTPPGLIGVQAVLAAREEFRGGSMCPSLPSSGRGPA